MKSKSFNLQQKVLEKVKQNKTFDFTSYYKTSEETNKALENSNVADEIIKGNKFATKTRNDNPKLGHLSKKKSKLEPIDISRIDIVGPSLDTSGDRSIPLNESKVTSTPQSSNKSKQAPTVKSIMKTSSPHSEDQVDESQVYATSGKSKKRNKSVSFMLDDNEEVVVKKTKSNESIATKTPKKSDVSKYEYKKKKNKKNLLGKENDVNVNLVTGNQNKINTNSKINKNNSPIRGDEFNYEVPNEEGKKDQNKKRKLKKHDSDETSEIVGEISNVEDSAKENKKKFNKKKALKLTPTETEADGEPSSKSRKKEVKPEAIVENLENLSIGDNAHTLTNLLDEMTVAAKDKRKKHKRKLKKDKNPVLSATSSDNADVQKVAEDQDRIKWQKRKWNKDKKGDLSGDGISTTVIVDNLPIGIVCSYKKLLSEHFVKYGLIKKIGIVEVYPTEHSKPVFTTTINFYSDGAATQALQEDNTTFEGNRIRIRRALPPTQTTLVIRSYAELSDQALSSIFLPAGKIRNIRHLVKGKKAIGTAFIDFDGPEALDKALQLAKDVKIGGKKMHAARFELRTKKPKKIASTTSQNEGDSEESNE